MGWTGVMAGAEVGAMVTLCHFVITDNKQKLGSAGQELMTPSLSLQSGVHSSRPALYCQPLYPAQHHHRRLYTTLIVYTALQNHC